MKKLFIAIAMLTSIFAISGCRTPVAVGVLPLYQEPVEIKGVQGAPSQYAMKVIVVEF